LVEFLHFDIQSTGQKSHCVKTDQQTSQCFVLTTVGFLGLPSHWGVRVAGSAPNPLCSPPATRPSQPTSRTPPCTQQGMHNRPAGRKLIKLVSFSSLSDSALKANSFSEVTNLRPDADMNTACHENNSAFLGFSRAYKNWSDTKRGVVLYGGVVTVIKKKRKLFPKLLPTCMSSFALPRLVVPAHQPTSQWTASRPVTDTTHLLEQGREY
uniref:RanBD1 domain-containing protein n=1 Tax=Taenia asiatica TaxID=60517 RepID=A0A0R3VVB4_TAEAS